MGDLNSSPSKEKELSVLCPSFQVQTTFPTSQGAHTAGANSSLQQLINKYGIIYVRFCDL